MKRNILLTIFFWLFFAMNLSAQNDSAIVITKSSKMYSRNAEGFIYHEKYFSVRTFFPGINRMNNILKSSGFKELYHEQNAFGFGFMLPFFYNGFHYKEFATFHLYANSHAIRKMLNIRNKNNTVCSVVGIEGAFEKKIYSSNKFSFLGCLGINRTWATFTFFQDSVNQSQTFNNAINSSGNYIDLQNNSWNIFPELKSLFQIHQSDNNVLNIGVTLGYYFPLTNTTHKWKFKNNKVKIENSPSVNINGFFIEVTIAIYRIRG